MTETELKQAIKSATKTLNSRLRRLKNEDLPSHAETQLKTARNMDPGLVTPSGYVSGSTKNMTVQQLRDKLKFIRGITKNTETVTQAREKLAEKMKEWNVNKQEAARRIRAGRVFYQVLGAQGYKWDSTQIQQAIEEFDSTPSYEDLENRLFEKFGQDMQDESEGREYLREWMNEHNEIPPGVYAHSEETPDGDDIIIYDDEYIDDDGNIGVNYEPDRTV